MAFASDSTLGGGACGVGAVPINPWDKEGACFTYGPGGCCLPDTYTMSFAPVPTLEQIKQIVIEAVREVMDEKRREGISARDALDIIEKTLDEQEE